MRRQSWFEFHDQPWFPSFLRDLVTEALEGVWNTHRTYRPIVHRLRDAVERSGSTRIIDLCSGGGGPWPALYSDVSRDGRLKVCLTDRYPNTRTVAPLTSRIDGLSMRLEPVDAQRVPPELTGFRTIFSSFHHFDPPQARAILADAFHRREGIAVLEAAQRSPLTIAAVTGVPLLAIRNALLARPRRFRRLFWSCIVPVVPLILWIDGVLSCLRSYSQDDMRELTRGLTAPDYQWQIGEERSGLVTIAYLIGTPTLSAATAENRESAARLPASQGR